MRNKLKEWEDNYFTIFDVFVHHNIKIDSGIIIGSDWVMVKLENGGIEEIIFNNMGNNTVCSIWHYNDDKERYSGDILKLAVISAHIINKNTSFADPCEFCVINL